MTPNEIKQLEKILEKQIKNNNQLIINEFNSKIDKLDNKIDNKIDKLDEKFTGKFKELDEKFTGKFNSLDKKFVAKFNFLFDAIGGTKVEIVGLTGVIDELKKEVSNLPTKAYIDEKLADLISEVNESRGKKESKVIQLLVKFLFDNKTLTSKQIKDLLEIKLFSEV